MPQLNLDHASMLRTPGTNVQHRMAQMIAALTLLLPVRLTSSWQKLFYSILKLSVAITVCLLWTNHAMAQTVARPRAIDRPPNTSDILPLANQTSQTSQASESLTGLQLARDAFDKGDYPVSFREYSILAQNDNVEAQQRLGAMYEYGFGVAKDDKAAEGWYKKAVKQADTRALDPGSMTSLGWLYENGKTVPKDQRKAVAWYEKAAASGFARAQNYLGVVYRDGISVAQDDKQAVVWFRRAAEQGNAVAQFNLGFMYQNGKGVAQDDKQAVAWYRKAADQGHAFAQNNLGVVYRDGIIVAQDDKQAVVWFRKAAEQGNDYAQTNLGWMFENGRGVPKDDKQAVAWYRKAAEQGNATAQKNLGWMYENGRGVAKDEKQAVAWYGKAAAQGNIEAMKALSSYYGSNNRKLSLYWLGEAAKNGDAESKEEFEWSNYRTTAGLDAGAITRLKSAAEQGDPEAQGRLGWIYSDGGGVPKNPKLAVYWFNKAISNYSGLAGSDEAQVKRG